MIEPPRLIRLSGVLAILAVRALYLDPSPADASPVVIAS